MNNLNTQATLNAIFNTFAHEMALAKAEGIKANSYATQFQLERKAKAAKAKAIKALVKEYKLCIDCAAHGNAVESARNSKYCDSCEEYRYSDSVEYELELEALGKL